MSTSVKDLAVVINVNILYAWAIYYFSLAFIVSFFYWLAIATRCLSIKEKNTVFLYRNSVLCQVCIHCMMV